MKPIKLEVTIWSEYEGATTRHTVNVPTERRKKGDTNFSATIGNIINREVERSFDPEGFNEEDYNDTWTVTKAYGDWDSGFANLLDDRTEVCIIWAEVA